MDYNFWGIMGQLRHNRINVNKQIGLKYWKLRNLLYDVFRIIKVLELGKITVQEWDKFLLIIHVGNR